MNPATHGLVGLAVAAAFSRNLKDLLLIAACGIIADLDGIFLLFDIGLYHRIHHTFGHNLFFGIMLIAIIRLFATDKTRTIICGFLAYSLHLAGDIIGTNWSVMPLWPMSDWGLTAARWWPDSFIYGPVNVAALIAALAALAAIAIIRLPTLKRLKGGI
jgi:hypothetical protein